MFSSRNNNSCISKSKLHTSNESRCGVTGLNESRKSNNFCFKNETNIKDKMQHIPNAGQLNIGSKKYEYNDCSNQVKHKDNVADRVRRQKKDSTELQFNDEQNIDSLRYKYKGRKSTSGNKEKSEINKDRKTATKESSKSSSTDDCVTRKSLIWLLHVQSKKQILDNTVNELNKHEDNKQNVWLQSDSKRTKNVKNKKIKKKNSKHEGNNSKDNRNQRYSKIDNSRTVVDSLSSKGKKYQTLSTSPISTDNSFSSSGNITNISQCKLETQQIIMKPNNNLSTEEKDTKKDKLKTLRPSKYERFHLILKKIEKKITEDIEKKLRKVLKMPEIKTYFENTLLASTDEKKTISSLMGALMQIIIILESQGIERREKCSCSKREESVDNKQSACYYVTNQQGNYDSKCSTNTNNENSTSSANETYFSPEDLKNKCLMKIGKLKSQNDVIVGSNYTYNDIDIHLSKIFDSCVSSEVSKYRAVKKYKKQSFKNKFNFEFQSIFKDNNSVITQNHNTYSTDVITNSNTQFLNTQRKDSLCSTKDLKVLSLLNEIYNTPNITDDKLNKLSLAVLKNIDCCIEKEDIPYIIVEMNKLVKYSKEIYDQIYNIYKTVNTLKRDERNIILMQHLFSKREYNGNCFETTVPGKDNKISTVLNAEYDTNKTETSEKCVGSENAAETANASSALNTKKCQKSNLYSYDQGRATACLNNKHIVRNKKESVMLKSTQFEKDKRLDFTEKPVSLPEDREYLWIPQHLDKKQNKNILKLNIENTESATINRTKEIYESYFRCCSHKTNIEETEACSLQTKNSQENNANAIHKTSDFYDVEMTDDSRNYSSDIPDELENNNEMPNNYFIKSFNVACSKDYEPKVFKNRKIDIERCKSLRSNYGERIRTTFKRKYAIDCDSRSPKRQCIKDQENCFWDYCVPQHKSINDSPISFQNVNLISRKKPLSDNFKNRTVESIPYESNHTFMIYSNNKFQNSLHSKTELQKESDMLQIHNSGIYVPHVPKHSKFVDDISYIHQSEPQISYSNSSESKSKQNILVNEQQVKYKTNFSNHKISIPYPNHYKNKAMLHNKKKNLMLDTEFRDNYATFGKHEGFGDSESLPQRYSYYPHHKIIRESNGIRIIVEDVVGKTSNDEELLQNVKHILNNTLKNTTDQIIHADLCNSMDQESSCSFSAGKMNNFQNNNLESMLYEPVKDCKMFKDRQIRNIVTDNSFVCMKDNNKFTKPQKLETKIVQKNWHFDNKQSEHSLIQSEAELCCITNTSSMETTNATREYSNKNNFVPHNNIHNFYPVNSYVKNPQDSSNNNVSTQFIIESDKENTYLRETTIEKKIQSNCIDTAIQKDSCQCLKCSDISPEECRDRYVLDSNTVSPLQVNKDSVKIYLKKDECIEIKLNRSSHKNISIQKLAKISEAEFKKVNNLMQPEILGHASISAECINSEKKNNVDSMKRNTKITPVKINTLCKVADFEKVDKKINSVNDQSCYNSALILNRYNSDKNVENAPAEMDEAQNINVYYCLEESQNSIHPSIPPNTNKSSYIPHLHCHGNSSLNENETNTDKKYVSFPEGPCLQENEYYNRKKIQNPKQSSAQPQLQEHRSEKSVFYDSSQFDPVDSNHMESRKTDKKGLRKITWSTIFSKLFIGRRLKSNDN